MSENASEHARHFFAPAPLVALCAWIVPGSGYFLMGQYLRGVVIGVTILLMFAMGLLIAGVRVIDVPGYDNDGQAIYLTPSGERIKRPSAGDKWALRQRPIAEIANKPWFVGQVLAGPVSLLTAQWSVQAARPTDDRPDGVRASHGRIFEIGTLYTAVAGMLNLLAIIDASWRAGMVEK